jgi:electron-transferring-flavoprotein dehydrogenase
MSAEDRADGRFRPSDHQPELPMERLVVREEPGEEALPLDVLFVGAGPAGLAGAIELARRAREDDALADLEIGVLEKSEGLGEHCLSGAVVDPGPFRELFPDVPEDELPFRRPAPSDRVYLLSEDGKVRIPTPPSMRNHGNRLASICEIVRWMGDRAEDLGVNLFTGFPADGLLVDEEGVRGVRTTPSGLDREGEPGSGYMPPTDVEARVTVLAEGTRGSLTQAWRRWRDVGAENPQIYALGVKELWETPEAPDSVIHTMGWPLPDDVFGGSFVYPMADDLVALGLVVGLDYPQQELDVHRLLQRFKTHPLVRPYVEDGELAEWGGKTIPEGGWWSLPERLHGDGVLVAGDAAGLVDVPSLKGIHYAVQSGIFAGRTIHEALREDRHDRDALAAYDRRIRDSFIADDLYRTRNMRLAYKDGGLWRGSAKAALMTATRGAFPGGRIDVEEDAREPRRVGEGDGDPDAPGLSKEDAVFRSGNATRDDIPTHLVVGEDVPPEVAEFYEHMCPAGVYRRDGDRLIVNAPNCIDCKATDVLGPRWTPREGGSGPGYTRM